MAEIIQFPGSGRHVKKTGPVEAKAETPETKNEIAEAMNAALAAVDTAAVGADETVMMVTKQNPDGTLQQVPITKAQAKALEMIMTGMSFIMIGLKPATTGADFYTSIHGDKTDLRNAHEHLYGVIDRAYTREGIE